jgi:hypothetical protein
LTRAWQEVAIFVVITLRPPLTNKSSTSQARLALNPPPKDHETDMAAPTKTSDKSRVLKTEPLVSAHQLSSETCS